MHTFSVQKLIRDALPEVMIASGMEIESRSLEDEEYAIELRKKLLEEAQEVCEASGQGEIREELADVLEVIQTLAHFHGMNLSDIVQKAEEKKQEKGGFQKRIYLNSVALPWDHPKLGHYQAYPEKYPEITDAV